MWGPSGEGRSREGGRQAEACGCRELCESWRSGRSCRGAWPPLQHQGSALRQLSTLESTARGKEPFVSQQSSLVWELGNYFGPASQQVLLASLAKLISIEGTCTKTRPSA